MLSVHDFHAGYPSVPVVSGAELRVERGEIVSLFGHNGAGKSTLMKGVFGVLGDCRGEVRFNDASAAGASTRSLMRRGMVLVPQERGVFPSLTVAENLRMGFWASGESARAEYDRRLARTLGYLPILDERKDDRAGELSGGQQQMVSIGRALLAGPKLLLLDEPSTGLAPNLVDDIMALVTRLREEEGLSVLLVEQKLPFARRVADGFRILEKGRLVAAGSIDALSDELVSKHLSV